MPLRGLHERTGRNDEYAVGAYFRNGRSQAVRIPKEFELQGKEVQITRVSETKLILETRPPERISPMLAWLAANGPIEDFPGDPGEEGLLPLDDVDI